MSVVIPCYNESRTIRRVLDALLKQQSSDGQSFADWSEIIVVNDSSTDGTDGILAEFEQAHRCVKVLNNEKNLGLAGSLNRGIQVSRAPFILSCQGDCHPVDDDYVSRILKHFRDEKVAVVTGKPVIPAGANLTLAEKAYLLLNIMDVDPEPEIVRTINFAEGRCDALRKSALVEAGLYNEKTRLSGEDQLMAIRMRERGFRILQDTALRYHLAAGGSQNSIAKVIRHQIQLAQGQAFVLSRAGFETSRLASTSANRLRRKRLRLAQITLVPLCLALSILLAVSFTSAFLYWILVIIGMRFLHLAIENRGRCSAGVLLRIVPIAFACDATYCWAFCRGLWRSWRRKTV